MCCDVSSADLGYYYYYYYYYVCVYKQQYITAL